MGTGPRTLSRIAAHAPLLGVALAVLGMAVVALCLGPYPLGPGDALRALWHGHRRRRRDVPRRDRRRQRAPAARSWRR